METRTRFLWAVSIIAMMLVIGTMGFHFLENWSLVDSFYFTGITLTTIGYGDLHPTKDLTKIVVVFFAFAGVALVLFALTMLAELYFERDFERFAERSKRVEKIREKVNPFGLAKKAGLKGFDSKKIR